MVKDVFKDLISHVNKFNEVLVEPKGAKRKNSAAAVEGNGGLKNKENNNQRSVSNSPAKGKKGQEQLLSAMMEMLMEVK